MTAILKIISYFYTLTTRIPRCIFVEVPQRLTSIPCTILQTSAMFSSLQNTQRKLQTEHKHSHTGIYFVCWECCLCDCHVFIEPETRDQTWAHFGRYFSGFVRLISYTD